MQTSDAVLSRPKPPFRSPGRVALQNPDGASDDTTCWRAARLACPALSEVDRPVSRTAVWKPVDREQAFLENTPRTEVRRCGTE